MNSQTHTHIQYRITDMFMLRHQHRYPILVCVWGGGRGGGSLWNNDEISPNIRLILRQMPLSQILVTRSFECEDPGLIPVLSSVTSVSSNSILNHVTGQF